MSSLQAWVSEHKLAGVGTLFASAMAASLAYARTRAPFNPSVKPLYARGSAQVLSLAVLSCAAVKQYYDVTDSVLEPDAGAPTAVPEGYFDPVADW